MTYGELTIEIRDSGKEAIEFIAELAKDVTAGISECAIITYSSVQQKTMTERLCEYLELMDAKEANKIMENTFLIDTFANGITPASTSIIQAKLSATKLGVVHIYTGSEHMILMTEYDVAKTTSNQLLKKVYGSYALRSKPEEKMLDPTEKDMKKTLMLMNSSQMLLYVITTGLRDKDCPHMKNLAVQFYATCQS